MEQSLLYDPKNIFILTSLIEIYSIVDPSLNEKNKLYERALAINPSFKKIYIIGLKDAIIQSDQDKINLLCNEYLNSILGEEKDYNKSYILGKSKNKIAIYLGEDVNKEQIYLNEGLLIGHNIVKFNILDYKDLNYFSIILPNSNYLKFNLNKIKIRSNNKNHNIFNADELTLISSNGIIENSSVTSISAFTNRLDILLPIQIDTAINEIILDFNLEKNLFYSKNVCINSLNE